MTAPALILDGSVAVGGRVILPPCHLEAPAGQWTCLLGPSGVGKSTVLQCFAGLPEGLHLSGQAGAGDGASLTGRLALMAQSDGLLPWLSLTDNVALGDRLRGQRSDRARAVDLLARVGLAGQGARKPSGLSGGQRQRVALARTLYEDRPVVLLDEPFSALDVATRARMQDLAAGLLRGRTVLHVTHDPSEAARLGQRILVLTARGMVTVPPPAFPVPRVPDAAEVLRTTGALTRLLLEAPCPQV